MISLDLGDWRVTLLETGYLRLDGGAMFGSVPRTLWSRTHVPDDRNRIRLAMRCLLAEGHGRRVLVDVGLGDKHDAKFAEIFAVESEPGLDAALAAAGTSSAALTDIVLTHLHFDHAGGATRRVDGRLVPAFPGATYHLQRSNLDNARHPNPRERASYLAENFEPLDAAGVLRLWDGAAEPWPGFELLPAQGHTRGQQLVRIGGSAGAVYFVADLVPTAAHVRIPYVMGYDIAAIETMREKQVLLARAAAERGWVVLEHDPQIALARPEPHADDFRWAETRPSLTAPDAVH